MKSRTLVKIKAEDQYLLFRTISQAKKSPTAFYIPRNSLEKLDGLYDPVVVVSNFPDFAEFRRNVARGELQVRFSWMNCTNDHLTGWTEAVTIPYEAFVRFLHNAAEGEQWSVLSSEENLSPRLIFCGGPGRVDFAFPCLYYSIFNCFNIILRVFFIISWHMDIAPCCSYMFFIINRIFFIDRVCKINIPILVQTSFGIYVISFFHNYSPFILFKNQ